MGAARTEKAAYGFFAPWVSIRANWAFDSICIRVRDKTPFSVVLVPEHVLSTVENLVNHVEFGKWPCTSLCHRKKKRRTYVGLT